MGIVKRLVGEASLLAALLVVAATPANAQETREQPHPNMTFDHTLELATFTLTEFSEEDFTFWHDPEVDPAFEIRVISERQAQALRDVFGPTLPSPFVVVVGDLGIDLPERSPASVNDMTLGEKIAARDSLIRRASSRSGSFEGGWGIGIRGSGEVSVHVPSEQDADIVRQFFGPDVEVSIGLIVPLPLPGNGILPGGPESIIVERVGSNLPLAGAMLGVLIVAVVGGSFYWRSRIGLKRYFSSVVLGVGVFGVVGALLVDSLLNGYPGFGRFQLAGVVLGSIGIAVGVAVLARSAGSSTSQGAAPWLQESGRR